MQPLCVFSVLYLRSNSWSLAFATGCARRRSPPDRRRLFRSAAQHGMEACAALLVMPPKTRPKTPVGGAGACGAVAGALDPPQCFSLHP